MTCSVTYDTVNTSGTERIVETYPRGAPCQKWDTSRNVYLLCGTVEVVDGLRQCSDHPTSCPDLCDEYQPDTFLGPTDFCKYPGSNGCPPGASRAGNCCFQPSPIIINVKGNGLNLSAAAAGVNFDLDADGIAEKLSWTKSATDDAWLTLDRNGNGLIDNGSELFGNLTPQSAPPAGEQRNGFLALAEYDKPGEGGI